MLFMDKLLLKRAIKIALIFVLFLFQFRPVAGQDNPVIFQYSTLNSLAKGLYEGGITSSDLMKNGDFGVGTFDGLDGEMLWYNEALVKVTEEESFAEGLMR